MTITDSLSEQCVSVLDRGLAYGDGVFRTMRLHNQKVQQWPLHYAKLVADCAGLGIVCPDEMLLMQDILRSTQNESAGVIKLIVTRGEGRRGYAPQHEMIPTRIAMYTPLPDYPAQHIQHGVKITVCALRLAHQPRLAGIKHLNRLEQVLARAEWQDASIAEGLMLDQHGLLVCGTMTNVFALSGQKLMTPTLDCCGVAGVTRSRILALAPALGLEMEICPMTLDTLLAADEVMLCNSVIGIWSVSELANTRWRVGPLANTLREKLERKND
uniref:aminodeoxychorismate lyase n=1 Tax=mine drainage metagenome TaxID=410659 RepID=E6QRZ2_9ZZZZ